MPSIFDSINSGSFSDGGYFICLAASLFCGVITALAASFRARSSRSFLSALVLLPMIVHTVITMVNGNVGTGVAVMGAFSLVRFRSVAGKARDIAAIFLAMTAGLACAAGYVGIAILFTLIVCAVMLLLGALPLGNEAEMELNVTVPETLRFAGQFDDLFKEYTKKHRLTKTKTTNMGSLYKLQFRIQMKDADKIQEFIDKLRCRNGNLEISICAASDEAEVL
jgi:uncharacterized membrane protein YhiD involved in acid resistance